MDSYKIDTSTFQISELTALSESDKEYWLNRSPRERLEALEFLRQQMYNYDPVTQRLQKVLTITERA